VLGFPWIRRRANRRHVTLHDVVAEELAQRIIPIHDQDKQWRHQFWSRAEEIYRERSESTDGELSDEVERLEEALHRWSARMEPGGQTMSADEERRIIGEAAKLEPRRRELSKMKAVRLYYELLFNLDAGCRLFLDLMGEAKDSHNIVFQNLLAAEMQRFLPGGAYVYALGDRTATSTRRYIRRRSGWRACDCSTTRSPRRAWPGGSDGGAVVELPGAQRTGDVEPCATGQPSILSPAGPGSTHGRSCGRRLARRPRRVTRLVTT
jgi:hypothetical protein